MSLCADFGSWSTLVVLLERWMCAFSRRKSVRTHPSPAEWERSWWDKLIIIVITDVVCYVNLNHWQLDTLSAARHLNRTTVPLCLSVQAPGCVQSAGSPWAGSGLVYLWCGVAAWYLTRLQLSHAAPQCYSALGIPDQARTPLQGVLAKAERTRSPNPPRSAGPGGTSIF